MYVHNRSGRGPRRGIVLVLILAMLGLLALIGVSFAISSGQAQLGSRRFAQSEVFPDSDQVMDFALAQVINDTSNPYSAIRGHGLKRDMYGKDAFNNGYVDIVPDTDQFPTITSADPQPAGAFPNTIQVTTNIPVSSTSFSFYGINFRRWILKIPGNLANGLVTQTFEVMADDGSGNNSPFHILTLTLPDTLTTNYSQNSDSFVGLMPTIPASPPTPAFQNVQFILDGRFRNAFNGPGMTNYAQYGNFRMNGLLMPYPPVNPSQPNFGDPNTVAMDEDYDAPDLENWFMALQSADGQVVIPSFHRPGILSRQDWLNTGISPASLQSQAKILRPRAIDHPASGGTFRDLVPDPLTGKIVYDVDNDGDGVTDAVWLDLGYPAQRDANGRMFKPLFAITVLGLNGRLPLNTAGNIQGRFATDQFLESQTSTPLNPPVQTNSAGDPSYTHAGHLGYSVNEISPLFALQNANDYYYNSVTGLNAFNFLVTDLNVRYSQLDNAFIPVNVTQLRNILTGTRPQKNPRVGPFLSPNNGSNQDTNFVAQDGTPYYIPNNIPDNNPNIIPSITPNAIEGGGASVVVRNTPPVAGRFGESPFIPRIMPFPPANAQSLGFSTMVGPGRSNLLTQGVPPWANTSLTPAPYWDDSDDDFDSVDPYPAGAPEGVGLTISPDYYDLAGAIQVPSERIRRFLKPVDVSGNGRMRTWNGAAGSFGADPFGRISYFQYFRPPGLPGVITYPHLNGTIPDYTRAVVQAPPVSPDAMGNAYFDATNNPFHGYESEQNPQASGAPGWPFAARPFPFNPPTFTSTTVPSIDPTAPINSLPVQPGQPGPPPVPPPYAVANGFLMGSLARDTANEVNLYRPNQFDAPFGPSDLEWLYRRQDVDGASLDSRLAKLAPISFLNAQDGTYRRRMFSIDSWETNAFVFAHDDPDGATFSNNSRATSFLTSAGLSHQGPNVQTPSLAHRDRKINLNFPLPVSTNPFEPIRQKWIRETYQFLKHVLPPKAIDTPEELAQLSQYLVNVVDFRDPDGAITIFTNPDVVTVAATTTTPPTLSLGSGPNALVQYGMEYNPIAINEVLAYSFMRKGNNGAAIATPRMFVELVNTLSRSGGGTNASDLNLEGWQLSVLPDDPTGRPDPISGQMPVSAPPIPNPPVLPFGDTGLPGANVKAMATAGPGAGYYYVMANTLPPPVNANFPNERSATTITPSTTLVLDPIVPTPPASGSGKYYWLYLQRPANPLDWTTASTTRKMVTVDSFRFAFTASNGSGAPPVPPSTIDTQQPKPTNDIYSLQRLQPYRGGQAVPAATVANATATPPFPPAAYGYSEQTAPGAKVGAPGAPTAAPPNGTLMGYYGQVWDTLPIPHTLGQKNNPADANWELFPFHDRDFTSVAEMLLVPGCPPGLFTKQFVERVPYLAPPKTPTNTGDNFPYVQPPTLQPANTADNPALPPVPVYNTTYTTNSYVGSPFTAAPRTYPYLIDNFYYTALNDGTANVVDGSNADGWHRALEFFEVPSTAFGAIGNVASGQNFDWYREDLKPGLLNLNLIIDEEVFFGLFDDPLRMDLAIVGPTQVPNNVGPPYQYDIPPVYPTGIPQVVTQIYPPGSPAAGSPSHAYPLVNVDYSVNGPIVLRGFMYWLDGVTGQPKLQPDPLALQRVGTADQAQVGLKAAFSDFLKLRHGGSGYLFAHGSGIVGAPNTSPPWPLPLVPTPTQFDSRVAADRPYRSLAFPDINYTIMRPATLPPSLGTNPPGSYPPSPPAPTPTSLYPTIPPPATMPQPSPFVYDPGLRNPFLNPSQTRPVVPTPVPAPYGTVQPPPIPTRRQFQITDAYKGTTPPAPPSYPSNASDLGDPNINQRITHPALFRRSSDLSNVLSALGSGAGGKDNRQHPAFRTEWLQKVMNLTTVRTHQYAVWMTVGFFEVATPGNPQSANPAQQIDRLGLELGAASGRNVRYRSFFILDRTKATGYNSADPGDFRDVVTYRRRIE